MVCFLSAIHTFLRMCSSSFFFPSISFNRGGALELMISGSGRRKVCKNRTRDKLVLISRTFRASCPSVVSSTCPRFPQWCTCRSIQVILIAVVVSENGNCRCICWSEIIESGWRSPRWRPPLPKAIFLLILPLYSDCSLPVWMNIKLLSGKCRPSDVQLD